MRLLIVEDEPEMLLFLKRFFKEKDIVSQR